MNVDVSPTCRQFPIDKNVMVFILELPPSCVGGFWVQPKWVTGIGVVCSLKQLGLKIEPTTRKG